MARKRKVGRPRLPKRERLKRDAARRRRSRFLYPESFEQKKHRMLRRRYKITLEEYQRLHTLQNGLCAICKKPESIAGNMLSVDHCHITDKVRGLLCKKCNLGLGHLGDTLEKLKAALYYLETV